MVIILSLLNLSSDSQNIFRIITIVFGLPIGLTPIMFSATSRSLKNLIPSIFSIGIYISIPFVILQFGFGTEVNSSALNVAMPVAAFFIIFIILLPALFIPSRNLTKLLPILYSCLGATPFYVLLTMMVFFKKSLTLSNILIFIIPYICTIILLASIYTKIQKAELYPKKI